MKEKILKVEIDCHHFLLLWSWVGGGDGEVYWVGSGVGDVGDCEVF